MAPNNLMKSFCAFSPTIGWPSGNRAIKSATSYHQQNDGVAFPGYNEKVFWANANKLFLGKVSAQQFVDAMAKDQAAYWKSQGK